MTRADILAAGCLSWLLAGVLIVGWHWWTAVPPILAFALLRLDGIVRPAAPWLLPVTAHGDRHRPWVALTFDDGPDAEVTPKVLDLLMRCGAHATFFVIAAHAERHPEIVRRMLAEGHEVGNHSYAHRRLLNFARPARMRREVEHAARALTAVHPAARSLLYRPPVGLKSPSLARVQRKLALQVIVWSLHARDTGRRAPAAVAARVLRRVRAGDIVLLHDGHDRPGHRRSGVVPALERILAGLAEKGVRSVTVGELLARREPVPRRLAKLDELSRES